MEERRILGGTGSRGFSKDLFIRGWQPWHCITQCWWKQHSAAPEGEQGSCHIPKVSSPASCRGGTRTWTGSRAPGSSLTPSPASPTPALSSHPGKLLLGAVPGEAAAVCKLLSLCLCLPGAWEGFTLPLSLCSEGAKSKSGHLEGKNLLNVTWLQLGWWSVALPGLSCMADSCSEQSQGGWAKGLRV